MRYRSVRWFSLVLAAMLLMGLAVPAGAIARTKPSSTAIKPTYVVPEDSYESDDTSAEANVFGEDLSEESVHTLAGLEDEDWVEFSADATGEPFVIETQSAPLGDGEAWFDSEIQVWQKDEAADGGLTQLGDYNDDSELWGCYGSTVYFTAPAPGTYYVQVYQNDPGENGRYVLYLSEGIARRIGGVDRYQTAAMLADRLYSDALNPWGYASDGPDGVILANGTAFTDALASGAWGAMSPDSDVPFPVLLTTANGMPKATLDEITKLAKGSWWDDTEFTVYVVGGPDRVSDAQVARIKALPYVYDVVRIAGDDRYETATDLADYIVGSMEEDSVASVKPQVSYEGTVVLVNGSKWADGVAAGSLCGAMSAPVLLSGETTLTPATRDWLVEHSSDVNRVLIVGDPSSISTDVADALADPMGFTVERVGGEDRYETAYLLAVWGVQNEYLDPSCLTLVTGESFPDGLAAGPFSMHTEEYSYGPAPILLTPNGSLCDEVADFWMDYGSTSGPSYIIGSDAAISADTALDFNALWSMAGKK